MIMEAISETDPNITDQQWVRECLSGKPEAFAPLVERYQRAVYNLCLRLSGNPEDALELSQEAFMKAYRSLGQYKQEYPFGPWLLRIARNLAIDTLRARKPQVSLETTEYQNDAEGDNAPLNITPVSAEPNAREILSKQETQSKLDNLIQSLPEPSRSILILKHIEEMKVEEIAQAMEMPVGTVKVQLHRARQLLKTKWEMLQ
jgi:RNA polymerase sigma-70 factor (ECF subfamily)